VVLASEVEDIRCNTGGLHTHFVRDMAGELNSFSVIHEGRETNQEAHCLAKHAL
jgi:hypothetical protein